APHPTDQSTHQGRPEPDGPPRFLKTDAPVPGPDFRAPPSRFLRTPLALPTRAHGDMGHFPTSGQFTEGFFTGQFFLEITNDLNGNSIEVNASGPGFNLEDGSFLLSGKSIVFLGRLA